MKKLFKANEKKKKKKNGNFETKYIISKFLT